MIKRENNMMKKFLVYTPAGSVVVDPDSPYHNHPGDFCPPGQAKKGRC